jgi:serine phosphatase RsbU (regulator of sigma subunit)
LLSQRERFKEAERYLLNAESIFLQIKNNYSIAQVNLDLANVFIKTERYDMAITRIEKGKRIIKENDYFYLQLLVNKSLWDYYKAQNDYKNAHYWLQAFMEVNDSIESIDRRENVDLLLAQFETERKEREIEILKKNDEINQLEIRRKDLNLYILILGLVVAFSFIIFLYVSVKRGKRMNELLAFHNVEIEQQKEEIIAQRDEIESKRDLLKTQNEKLEHFRTHTTQSLRYAQSIQAAILPSDKFLQQISPESFVLMKPCELVSGDFFWASTVGDFQIFCVADCTGHGVPGAFMSILGITALNDIVSRHKVTKPSEILGYLRESVIEALSQNDPEELHKDGMDIALCVLNTKTRELQFAGAGLPLWIVAEEMPTSIISNCSSEPVRHNGFSICEVKGDIMPVGQSPRMTGFTNHTIMLGEVSIKIYLSSDGYSHQPGGAEGKKFQRHKLMELIVENQDKSLENQKSIFENTFEQWMGKISQIDDVTLLGLVV